MQNLFKNLTNFYRISIKAVVLNPEKKFLLAKEINGNWDFLGGGLDFGESAKDCLIREIMEESGLKVSWISNSPCYFLTDKKFKIVPYANLFYLTKLENLSFKKTRECQELRFFSPEEILNLKTFKTFDNVKKFAKNYTKIIVNKN
jgi:8-oxo-dGTP pyrophosphatase MutT (NUDIX family)